MKAKFSNAIKDDLDLGVFSMTGRCDVPGMIQPTDRLCGVRLDLHPPTSEAQLAPQDIAS